MNYKTLIIDSLSYMPEQAVPLLQLLADNGRLIVMKNSQYSTLFKNANVVSSPEEMILAIDKLIPPDIILNPATENIRYRHVIKGGDHYYILFNEEDTAVNTEIQLSVPGEYQILNPYNTLASQPSSDNSISFQTHELKILWID